MNLEVFKHFDSPAKKEEYARAILSKWMSVAIYDHPCFNYESAVALAYAISDHDEKRCVHVVEVHQFFVRVIFNEPWTLGLPCVVVDKFRRSYRASLGDVPAR